MKNSLVAGGYLLDQEILHFFDNKNFIKFFTFPLISDKSRPFSFLKVSRDIIISLFISTFDLKCILVFVLSVVSNYQYQYIYDVKTYKIIIQTVAAMKPVFIIHSFQYHPSVYQ